jgi:hypothetical protein
MCGHMNRLLLASVTACFEKHNSTAQELIIDTGVFSKFDLMAWSDTNNTEMWFVSQSVS